LFAEDEKSLGERARQRRWVHVLDAFPDLREMSVLDLGGTAKHWLRAPVQPRSVHVVNIAPQSPEVASWIRMEQGDACALPDSTRNGSYDLVYSNSVIEHVGGHQRREDFAEQVRASGAQHWVQTPYRYFPVEPHWIAPAMQFLPLRLRGAFGRRWPLGFSKGKPVSESVAEQLNIELLDITMMKHYFPGDRLVYERVGPFVKSIVAVKQSG